MWMKNKFTGSGVLPYNEIDWHNKLYRLSKTETIDNTHAAMHLSLAGGLQIQNADSW